MQHLRRRHSSAFTLVEICIAIAIVVVIAIVVLVTLSPAEFLRQGRDANRVAAMRTLNGAIGLYYSDAINSPSTLFLGTSSVVYISIPDSQASTTAGDQCQGLSGLPTLTSGWTYHCVSSANVSKVDGTGWVPVNLKNISVGAPIATFPIDPQNTTSSGKWYQYTTNGISYEFGGFLESKKYNVGGSGDVISKDGSTDTAIYEQGTNFVLLAQAGSSGGGGGGGGGGTYTFSTSTLSLTSFSAGIGFDSNTNTMWVTSGGIYNTVTKINDTAPYATTTYAMPFSSNNGVAYDSNTHTIWTTDTAHNAVVKINDTTFATTSYKVGSGPRGITFDSHTNTLWTANQGDGTITKINDTTFATTSYFVGGLPTGIAFDSNTNTIWVTAGGTTGVVEVNDTTLVATNRATLSSNPQGIGFDSHTNTIWAADNGGNLMYQINDSTYATSTYATGNAPVGVAFDSHTNSVWVTNSGDQTATRIDDTTFATTTYYTGPSGSPVGAVFDSHTNVIWVLVTGGTSIVQFTPDH